MSSSRQKFLQIDLGSSVLPLSNQRPSSVWLACLYIVLRDFWVFTEEVALMVADVNYALKVEVHAGVSISRKCLTVLVQELYCRNREIRYSGSIVDNLSNRICS